MESGSFNPFVEEDRRLAVGLRARACWDDQGYRCVSSGKIVKLSSRSVTVKLSESAGASGMYRKGSLVVLPRLCDQENWRPDNCVRLEPRRASSAA